MQLTEKDVKPIMDEVFSMIARAQTIPTYFCPKCKRVSAAERDENGDPVCPHCDFGIKD